jgi:copper transporter 1
MRRCQDYNNLCRPGSVVLQCQEDSPIPNLPTTSESRNLVKSICSYMDMSGCEKCATNDCDSLQVYTDLCSQVNMVLK